LKVLTSLQRGQLLSIAVIVFGVGIAIFDKVRTGSVLIAVGTAVYAFLRYREAAKKRRIELFLPLLLAAVLFVVALTLPHAR